MPIAGIILNVTDPMDAGLAHDTKEEIERIGGNKVLAVIPFLGQEKDTDAPRAPLVARAVASLVRQVDFRSLLGTEGMRKTYASGRFRRRRAGD
jgi:ribosomal protein S19E (S16A)